MIPLATIPRPPSHSVGIELRYRGGREYPVALMTLQFVGKRPPRGCEYWPPCSRSVAPFRGTAAPRFAALPEVGDPMMESRLQSVVNVVPGSEVIVQVDGTGASNGEYLALIKVSDDLDAAVSAYRNAISRGKWAGPIQDDGERTDPGDWHSRSWSWPGYDGGPITTLAVLRHGGEAYIAIKALPS
jgi:hypothetical protein